MCSRPSYLTPSPSGVLEPVAAPELVAAQATSIGREVHRLTVWNGRLYLAYGDYAANTGPIHALSLDLDDPATVIDETTLHTEETWTFRAHGGRLFVPYVDPQAGIGNPENGQYAVAAAPGSWSVVANVDPYPVHVMDVVETADGLFLFGTSSTAATIWRSTDDGATWTTALTVSGALGDDTARFEGVMLYGTTVIAVFSDPFAAAENQVRTFRWDTAGPWVEVTNAGGKAGDAVPFTYDGTPFHLCNASKGQAAVSNLSDVRTLPEDDAQRATIAATIPTSSLDAAVTADGLTAYLLDQHNPQRVWRGDTTGSWAVVLTLAASNPDVVCIAVDEANGYLYFGSTDSQILRHAIPA